jgi:hypothetical protein
MWHNSRTRRRAFGPHARRLRPGSSIGGRPALVDGIRSQASEGSADWYTHAVGLLVPREDSFDEQRTIAAIEVRAAEVSVELPRDLPLIAEWPRMPLDGDCYQHRVALATASGGYELLQHFCADDGRAHEQPGHHSWGDSGHEADDLAYSLLCVRYGGPFRPGWRGPDPTVPAMLFPGLFDVIARLCRGLTWRMQWERLSAIAVERGDR